MRLAEMEIIDIAEKESIREMWSDFIVGTYSAVFDSFQNSILIHHPRRSCEAFAFATLQQRPWHEELLPEFDTLQELADWITPFLNEEKAGKLLGEPHW